MKTMKIEINAEQPLDEVVRELERLGYYKLDKLRPWDCFIYTFDEGLYYGLSFNTEECDMHKLTTLAELKGIK